MARESEIGTTFYQAMEIAWRIEPIRCQGREAMMRDKRPCRCGSFSSTSFGGGGQFTRRHHGRRSHFKQYGASGVVIRSSFSTPIASYFSALLVSLHHVLSVQGSSSGYSEHQEQIQVQQPPLARWFLTYGQFSHIMRHCPGLYIGVASQISQSIFPSLVASSLAQSSIRQGHVAKDCPRGGGQVDSSQSGGS